MYICAIVSTTRSTLLQAYILYIYYTMPIIYFCILYIICIHNLLLPFAAETIMNFHNSKVELNLGSILPTVLIQEFVS